MKIKLIHAVRRCVSYSGDGEDVSGCIFEIDGAEIFFSDQQLLDWLFDGCGDEDVDDEGQHNRESGYWAQLIEDLSNNASELCKKVKKRIKQLLKELK